MLVWEGALGQDREYAGLVELSAGVGVGWYIREWEGGMCVSKSLGLFLGH